MMKKSNLSAISFLLFISFIFGACANEPDKSGYELWNDSLSVSWQDFKGEENRNNARMAYVFDISIEGNGSEITCEVKTFMDKNKSQKMKGHYTDYLLEHEISHLKLAEVHARMLRKEISEIKESDFQKAIAEINKLYANHIERDKTVQAQYDEETNHSLEQEKQKEWNEKIDQKLKSLEKYSNVKVQIKIVSRD